MTILKPIDVVCPLCYAAIGARCTEPKSDGNRFVDYVHTARISRAIHESTIPGPFDVMVRKLD